MSTYYDFEKQGISTGFPPERRLKWYMEGGGISPDPIIRTRDDLARFGYESEPLPDALEQRFQELNRKLDELSELRDAREGRRTKKNIRLLDGFMGMIEEYAILIDKVVLKPQMAERVLLLHTEFTHLEETFHKETLTKDALLSFLEKVDSAYREIHEEKEKSGDER